MSKFTIDEEVKRISGQELENLGAKKLENFGLGHIMEDFRLKNYPNADLWAIGDERYLLDPVKGKKEYKIIDRYIHKSKE